MPRETTDQWAERAIREHMASSGDGVGLATTRLLAAFARMTVDRDLGSANNNHATECIRALVAAEARLPAEGLT